MIICFILNTKQLIYANIKYKENKFAYCAEELTDAKRKDLNFEILIESAFWPPQIKFYWQVTMATTFMNGTLDNWTYQNAFKNIIVLII